MFNIGKQNKEEKTDSKPILPENAVEWAPCFLGTNKHDLASDTNCLLKITNICLCEFFAYYFRGKNSTYSKPDS